MKNRLLLLFALLAAGCNQTKFDYGIYKRVYESQLNKLRDSIANIPNALETAYKRSTDSMAHAYKASLTAIQQHYQELEDDLTHSIAQVKAMTPAGSWHAEDFETIRIRYTNRINGYRVTALWRPEFIGYHGKIIGKAILTFTKGDLQFSMVHSHFFINGPLSDTQENAIKLNSSVIYDLEYPELDKSVYLQSEVPFFFVDKGSKLVLTLWAEGNRGSNMYRFYKMEKDGSCKQDHANQITYEDPYRRIDDDTKFKGDHIYLYFHGGIAYDDYEKYTRIGSSDEYELEWISKLRDFNMLYTYKLKYQLIKTQFYDPLDNDRDDSNVEYWIEND